MINLRELRKGKKVSQKVLAEYLGVSQQAYANYESGKRQPDIDTLVKIACFFEITIDELLGNSKKINIDFYSPEETALITAYRAHPEMHDAVHRILGIVDAAPNYRLVAFGGDNENKNRKSEPHIT